MTASIRGITPEDFFPYENNTDPPSIAFARQMRRGTKSDLLPCLESVTPKSKCAEIPNTYNYLDLQLFHLFLQYK